MRPFKVKRCMKSRFETIAVLRSLKAALVCGVSLKGCGRIYVLIFFLAWNNKMLIFKTTQESQTPHEPLT